MDDTMDQTSMSEDAIASDQAASMPASHGRLLLPVIKLKNGANSKQLEQRLNYLWNSAHAMLNTSPTIAHTLAAGIMETARQERVQLPSAVLDYLCQQCGGLVVPSVTADVHVVPQHHRSPMSRKLARQQRKQKRMAMTGVKRELLVNVLSIRCRRCGFANLRHGASLIHKPREKKPPTKRRIEGQQTDVEPDTKKVKTDQRTIPSTGSENAAVTEKAPSEPPAPVVRSVFAKPPSPPRKLLDAKKKKKKPAATAAAAASVKSNLNSFLQTLRK